MTIRQQIEEQLKTVSIRPDQSQLKNELIEAIRWSDAAKTNAPDNTYEDGVVYTLMWVLGIREYNPIDEEYQKQ